jgi:hypothetical protein
LRLRAFYKKSYAVVRNSRGSRAVFNCLTFRGTLKLTGAGIRPLVAPVDIAIYSFGILPKLALQLSWSVAQQPALIDRTHLARVFRVAQPPRTVRAPLAWSVRIGRHRRAASRRDGPVVDPLPSDAVGSIDEFSTWRSPVLHHHHDPGVEMALRMIDVG